MADGIVETGATGKQIDNSVVGSSAFRQRVVIGGDNSSENLLNPSTVWPTSSALGLPIRIVGSSGIVLGMVAPSSVWTVTASVAATTTLNLGPSTELIGRISSGTQTIGTVVASSGLGASTAIIGSLSSGTAQIGILGPSSANVIGTVAQSSNWNISTGAVVGLTTTAVVALTTANTIGFTSATLDLISGTTGNKYLPVRLTDGSTFYTAGGGAGSTLVSLSSGATEIGSLGPSSAIVIGSVAPSSVWTVSATVAATTTLNLGPSTELIGRISSGTQTIGTVVMSSGLGASTAIIGSLSSGTAQIGILGPSSANVIGTVAQSSNWNISTGAVVGLTTTSIVNLSSALANYVTNSTTVPVFLSTAQLINLSSAITNYVTNSTTVPVFLSTAQLINLSSAIANYITNSTTVPVYLGASTSNIVGLVSQSSAFALSSGTAYVGTVVNASSGVVFFSTTSLFGLSTTANIVSGVANYAGQNPPVTSGSVAPISVDTIGRVITQKFGGRALIKTATLVTAANTCQQQLLAGTAAATYNDLLMLEISSTAGLMSRGTVLLFSSSGQAEPGMWLASLSTGPVQPYSIQWPSGLIDPSTQPWFAYSTQAVRFTISYVLATS